MAIRIKSGTTVMSVVGRLMKVIIGLYVGGLILDALGTLILGTSSPFYQGLSFIGWTVNTTNGVTAVNANTGILGVVGIIAIAGVVLSFVNFSM